MSRVWRNDLVKVLGQKEKAPMLWPMGRVSDELLRGALSCYSGSFRPAFTPLEHELALDLGDLRASNDKLQAVVEAARAEHAGELGTHHCEVCRALSALDLVKSDEAQMTEKLA